MPRLLSLVAASALALLASCQQVAPNSQVPPTPAPNRAADYDLVIRQGRIVDGTGAKSVTGDVAVKAGRIVAVGAAPGVGRVEIKAAGRVIAPGFIDVHTHSEDVLEVPQAEHFLRMGVTTIIAGNCGTSNVDVAWFFRELERIGVSINVGTLVGQGSVRQQVMGGSFMRPATATELAQMRSLVKQAMEAGAVGLSTGLIYLPGTYTKTEEIIELAKVAAAAGGIYASHMRHEDTRIVDAIDELVRIAREAGIRAELSHLKLSGPNAWGRADEILRRLDAIRASGVELTHDQYVYTASSTGIGSNLIDSEYREGGTARFRARLTDPATKAKMVASMKNQIARSKRGDYSYAVVAEFKADPRINGRNIPEAAKILRGANSLEDQIETILDIEARGGAQGVFHGMNEGDLQKFLAHPLTMIASDSGMRRFGVDVPHPRGYGNNARVFARYVRELQVLSVEEAVRKMTSLPAQAFRLPNRGVLKAGAVADIVVFDPAKVQDTSTYADPHHYAVGFDDVIVNGIPVIRDAKLTNERPGKPVRLSDR